MIDRENRFRQPNQSSPKSMDAFVNTIGVRENAQCCWVRTPVPCPNSAEQFWSKPFIFFPENDVRQEAGLLAKNAELVFVPFLGAITPIPTRILLYLFCINGKINYSSSSEERTLLRERLAYWERLNFSFSNDGPIGMPIDDALRQETLPVDFFFERHALCNAK